MAFIAFLGCDGCGKSALVRSVAENLEASGYQVALGHWRPKLFGRQLGPTANTDDPHRLPPRGFVLSILKLFWIWFNWWVAWYRHLRSTARRGYILFDRYHADLIVDPRRYRYGGPMRVARLASRWMPQPDLVIYLDAEPEVLLSRKQEVGLAELIRARVIYLKFASATSCAVIVDASMPISHVTQKALFEISRVSSFGNIKDGI